MTHSCPTRRSSDRKPAGVLGVSIGAIGTAVAQQHLRGVLAYLDVPTLGQPEAFIQAKEGLFDSAGNIGPDRSEEHTSELQSLMRISYAVFCLKKKKNTNTTKQV